MSERDLSAQLEALRADFDRGFAESPGVRAEGSVPLLAIELGGQRYALRLNELAGVVAAPDIVPVPGAPPGLIGLAGLRGCVVPVYNMGAALGVESRGGRWLALHGEATPVGLTFDGLTGYVEVSPAQIHPADPAEAARAIRQIARSAAGDMCLIEMPAVVAALLRVAVGDGLEETPR